MPQTYQSFSNQSLPLTTTQHTLSAHDTNTLLICYKYTLSKQFNKFYRTRVRIKMAAKYPQEIPVFEPESLDTVEISVRKTFNSLIEKLMERRDQLIKQICEIRDEYKRNETKRIKYLQEVDEEIRKRQEESASDINNNMIKYLSAQKEENKHPNPIPPPPHFDTFHLDELRDQIERFGALEDPTQIYPAKLSPIRSIGKSGEGRGELNRPYGVTIDGKGNIFIADTYNCRIQLVSLEGQFIREFGKGELSEPHSIARYNDWLFVTDSALNKVLKYETQNYKLECKSELELNYPLGITVDNNEVFVVDGNNHRIVVLSLDLKFIRELGNKELVAPREVKVNNNKVFVGDASEHHNVHVFSKLGDLLNSIISLRDGVSDIFLCFDKFSNILISDSLGKLIRICTLEGQLIHSIECDYRLTGIAVTQDNIIICVDCDNNKLNLY